MADVLMQPIKDIWNNLKIGEENLLVLEGKTRDGIPFYGSQWILVVDNKPHGRPQVWRMPLVQKIHCG